MAEVELDGELRGLQVGDEMRGSSASQSNGCCFDTTVFQQLFATGTEQALQQIAAVKKEPTENLETQHQPAPATPVHVPEGGGGDEKEEEQREKSAESPNGVNQRQEAVMKGFRLVLFLILPRLQGMQMKATETSSTHLEGEGKRGRHVRRERSVEETERSAVEIPFTSKAATAAGSRRWFAVKRRQCGTRKPKEKETASERTRAPLRIGIKVTGCR